MGCWAVDVHLGQVRGRRHPRQPGEFERRNVRGHDPDLQFARPRKAGSNGDRAGPRHELVGVARRVGVDFQAAPGRDVPRRDAVERRGGQVQLRPHGGSQRSLQGAKDADYSYWDGFMADYVKEAKAVDPYTLQLVMKQPNAPLLYNLSIMAFEFNSPASFKKYGGTGVGLHPVGTGPFKFVEWVRDDHVTMVANPSFFRKGLPKVQRLIMRVIKDNAARFLALKSGEINAMEAPNPDDVRVAQSDPNLKTVFRPAFNTGYIRFNMNDPLFKDKRIREATALAINRKAIVDALYGGYGTVANQHMPPTMWGRADVPPIPYDPAKAKQLLAEANYPNGFSVDFWYIPVSRPYFPNGKESGTAVASDLAKVGIRAHLMTEDWATYL